MNLSALPDLLAIGVLIAVFRSILKRNPDAQAHYWLIGWVIILIHFIAHMFDIGTGVVHHIALSITLITLVLAAQAFMSAVRAESITLTKYILYCSMFSGSSILYLICYSWGVQAQWPYYVLAVCAMVFGMAGFFLVARQQPLGPSVIICFLAMRLLIIPVIYFYTADAGVIWILFDFYLGAAFMLPQPELRKQTTGMNVLILSFFAWALVFPVSQILAMYAPQIHVEAEVWNLPKFLVAVGMILVLLENEINHHEYLALHDELTGLPNRRLFEDRLQQALDRAHRLGKHVALLNIDLNHFKNVNDTFGHQSGDYFLKAVAARFQQIVRRADTIARTGGDEFSVVVCDLPNRETADQVVRSLQQVILEPVMIRGWSVPISASIGMALYSEDGDNKISLAAAADAAMYRAKQKARELERQGNITAPVQLTPQFHPTSTN